jgi:signal transduction histidine kinase
MELVEITHLPPLSPAEQALLDAHGLLNILNILQGELVLIGLAAADDPDWLPEGLEIFGHLHATLTDPKALLAEIPRLTAHEAILFAEIEARLAERPDTRENPSIRESLDNLRSIFAILHVRGRELLARAHAPDYWEDIPVAELRESLINVLGAIERNAKGRFHFRFNAALQREFDYYVDLKIESANGPTLRMPLVLQDVMRDLIANARKYTAPGGHITAHLHQNEKRWRFVIEDTGRGIPPDEITRVVEFGRRAPNVADVSTKGGGFGLTKAYLVTKQFGGRFWIGSRLGVGTKIRIDIPMPRA